MTPPHESGESAAERLLALLEPVLAADTLETAATAAVRGIAVETGAVAAALFVVLHGKVFLEFWHPHEAGAHPGLRGQFHDLAVRAAHADPGNAAVPSGGGAGRIEVYRLPMKQRYTGVLCLSYAGASVRGTRERLNERLAALVAQRLQAVQDVDAERKKVGQYEHWFRMTDKQIRALDRERQKLVVLANHFDARIFVTDVAGTVRWTNRVLAEGVPGPTTASTWIGRACGELCASAGEGHAACGGCLIERVRRSARAGSPHAAAAGADAPTAADPQGAGAYAIRDLQGLAEEIMVVLPDPPARRKAA